MKVDIGKRERREGKEKEKRRGRMERREKERRGRRNKRKEMERREKKKNGGIKETGLEVVHRQIIDNSDETNFTNAYFPLYLVFHILEIEQQAAVLGLVSWRDVLMDCIQPILNLIGNLLHLLLRSVLQVACIFTPVRRGRR